MMVVDISSSGSFGTEKYQKREIGAEIASVLGFSAIKNNDKVGLVLFSDDIVNIFLLKKVNHIFCELLENFYMQNLMGKALQLVRL